MKPLSAPPLLMIVALFGACETAPETASNEPPPPLASPTTPVFTPGQQAAYDQCLSAHERDGTGWDQIQAQCRSEAMARP